MIVFLQKSCYSVVKDSRCCTLYRVSIDYSLFPSKSIHIFLIKPAHCGVSHISDHNRGRRDMSTLALSVWWCRPTGSAARVRVRSTEWWGTGIYKRFRGRVFMAGVFLGRGASNSTRNASPQPALPPGLGLAALLLSNVRAHAQGRPSQQESRAITQNSTSSIALPHYARPNASLGAPSA